MSEPKKPEAKTVAEEMSPEKRLYSYTPKDAPGDVVINAANHGMVIGSPANLPDDNPRLDSGDRRQGPYYIKLVGKIQGLQLLRNLSMERARDLEKKRLQRTGELPPDWVQEAKARAENGGGPPPFAGDINAARSNLQRAVHGHPVRD